MIFNELLLYVSLLSGFIAEARYLTHVVMPFHPRQSRAAVKNIRSWAGLTPCSGEAASNVTFIFYLSCGYDQSLESSLILAFKNAPKEVLACFRSVYVVFADLGHDGYLTGSRLMFEKMLSKEIGYRESPSHVFYMEPDCRPIRKHWLNAVCNQVIVPNARFWMKGSIFSGDIDQITNRYEYNIIHINGNAIYNVSDDDFRKFYFEIVRPFIQRHFNEGAYDTDFFKLLLWNDGMHSRHVFHLFQFSIFVQNYYHSDFSQNRMMADSPDTYLVHGGRNTDLFGSIA